MPPRWKQQELKWSIALNAVLFAVIGSIFADRFEMTQNLWLTCILGGAAMGSVLAYLIKDVC